MPLLSNVRQGQCHGLRYPRLPYRTGTHDSGFVSFSRRNQSRCPQPGELHILCPTGTRSIRTGLPMGSGNIQKYTSVDVHLLVVYLLRIHEKMHRCHRKYYCNLFHDAYARNDCVLIHVRNQCHPCHLRFAGLHARTCLPAPGIAGGKSSKVYLWLSALLLAANIYTRYEGVIFPATLGIFMLIHAIKKKNRWIDFLYWCLIIIAPFLVWKIYQRLSGMYTESFVVPLFAFDSEKAGSILSAFWGLLKSNHYYGWTFSIAAIAFIANLWFVFKKKDSLLPFATLFLSPIFYAYYTTWIMYGIPSIMSWLTLPNVSFSAFVYWHGFTLARPIQ